MHRSLPLTASLLALAGSAVAQNTIVSPAAWADVEAPSGNAFPFGSTAQQFRYLNVHDDLAGTARTILGFALRRSGTTSTTVTPPISVVVDLFMSTAVTTGATVDATFDNNHGADRTQVVLGKTINFPQAPTGLLPYPFLYTLPLDVPFVFGGGGPLAWEVQISSRPQAASTFHDYVSGAATNPSMVVSRFGSGCTATGRSTTFSLTGSSTTSWSNGTGQVSATAGDGPANAPAVLLTGFSASVFQGLPLPLLLPFTQGSASGACHLYTDGIASLPGTLNAGGDFTFRFPVPLVPQFNGLDLYSQVAAPDTSNALGVVTSNGLDHQVVAPYTAPPGGRVYRSGSLAATGTVGASQTLVVQFFYN